VILREKVLRPILAGVGKPKLGRKPTNWTSLDDRLLTGRFHSRLPGTGSSQSGANRLCQLSDARRAAYEHYEAILQNMFTLMEDLRIAA